jgi:hypothetical protein
MGIERGVTMTLVIALNATFVALVLALLAATMRLPFWLRSGEEAHVGMRQHRVRRPRPARAGAHRATRGARGRLAS